MCLQGLASAYLSYGSPTSLTLVLQSLDVTRPHRLQGFEDVVASAWMLFSCFSPSSLYSFIRTQLEHRFLWEVLLVKSPHNGH